MFMTFLSFFITAIIFLILIAIFEIRIWEYYVPASLVVLALWLKAIQPFWSRGREGLTTNAVRKDPSAAAGWISIISFVYGIATIFLHNWIALGLCAILFLLSLTMRFSY